MQPGEKLNSLRSRQFMAKLGLTRDVVYKYLWDMKQKKDGLKRMASKEQLREEIDDLAALLKIDITPQAEAIVQQDSPFATRDTLKLLNKKTMNHSPASCES